jgi:circadian clock protein KaiB
MQCVSASRIMAPPLGFKRCLVNEESVTFLAVRRAGFLILAPKWANKASSSVHLDIILIMVYRIFMDRKRDSRPPKTTKALPKRDATKPAVKELTNSSKAEAGATAAVEWDLQLYVSGSTPKSAVAFGNLKRLCDEHLAGRYRMKIIDLTKNPELAQADQIVALPSLVRKGSVPNRQIIGNLTDTARVLASLGIEGKKPGLSR